MLTRPTFALSRNINNVSCCLIKMSRNYAAQKSIADKLRDYLYPQFPTAPYDFICQIGDPVLRMKCGEVETSSIKTKSFQSLIKLMWSVSDKYKCDGLSAPQIGVPLQVSVIDCIDCHRRVLINPRMKVLDYSTKMVVPEGCLSVEGFCAQVARYGSIKVDALNEEGQTVSWDSFGHEAIVIQHEIDHLKGIMYVDKMEPQTLECMMWQQLNLKKGKGSIRFGPQKKTLLQRINSLSW